MSQHGHPTRRVFLRNAGLTALAGAVAPAVPAVASAARSSVAAPFAPPGGKFDFDSVCNRFGTDSVKFDSPTRTYGRDCIQVGMGIADLDFHAAPCITKALEARTQHDNWGYLSMPDDVAEAIVGWTKRRTGVSIQPSQLVISSGVHPGIIAALLTFSPRGSRVLLQTPTYSGFYSDLSFTQTKAEESPLKLVSGKYSMDFEDFERRIGHDTNTFILCNPQNPTGNCWSAEDLTRIGEICLRRRVIVLADEIHSDFVMKGTRFTPFASLPNKAIVDNSVTFTAVSKSFGLAAHKFGWFFSTNPDLLARIKVNHRADLNTLGVVANRAALAGGEEWLAQAVQYIDGTHDLAASYIADKIPAVRMVKPEGTYLCWLDISEVMDRVGAKELTAEYNRTRASGMRQQTPEEVMVHYLVRHAKVHMSAGTSYGLGGEGHVRMNIGTSRKMVELALGNIAALLRNPPRTLA